MERETEKKMDEYICISQNVQLTVYLTSLHDATFMESPGVTHLFTAADVSS